MLGKKGIVCENDEFASQGNCEKKRIRKLHHLEYDQQYRQRLTFCCFTYEAFLCAAVRIVPRAVPIVHVDTVTSRGGGGAVAPVHVGRRALVRPREIVPWTANANTSCLYTQLYHQNYKDDSFTGGMNENANNSSSPSLKIYLI